MMRLSIRTIAGFRHGSITEAGSTMRPKKKPEKRYGMEINCCNGSCLRKFKVK